MKKYRVTIIEENIYRLEIEAECESDAIDDAYNHHDFVTNNPDDNDSNYEVEEIK